MNRPILIAISTSIISTSYPAISQQLNFEIESPTSGSISTQRESNSDSIWLIGDNIDVDSLFGINTSLNNGVSTDCDACLLNFDTGGLTNYDVDNSQWTFSGGGTISITGGLDFVNNDIVADLAPGNELLTGTFVEATVISLATGGFEFAILGASFEDIKHPSILEYYGFNPNTQFVGGLNISFLIDNAPTSEGEFSSNTLFSGNLVNNVTAVPLPATLFLMISSLVGLGFTARRNKTR